MPPRPLRIRPAARSRRVAPAPKPKARPKRKAKDSSANPPSPPGWIDVKKVAHDTFPLGSLLHLEVFYQDETGDMVGKLEETHQDTEGIWLGIAVKGTKLTGLRSWRLTHPGAHEYLYVCYQDTPVEKRLKIGSVAYLVRAKKIDSVPLEWGKNCEEGAFPDPPLPGQEVETAPLRLLAENLEAPPAANPKEDKRKFQEETSSSTSTKKKKKSKKKREKVRHMVQKAKWNCQGTPLDPKYRRPIKISLSKTDNSSSSSAGSQSSAELATDHRLRAVSRRLPGYLTRRSARDASTVLAQATTGEEAMNYANFRKYYRQILVHKTTSRPMLREMATLTSALDKILDGSILEVADLLSQRLKSLEMIAGGADPMIATEVELLPREMAGLTSEAEGRYAQKEYLSSVKLQKVLKGNGKGKPDRFPPKGDPKGDSKNRWGPPKGKGKEGKGKGAEESKVTRPS